MIYLYVKTHNVTGLKYLGQTKRDPNLYLGSGKYWRCHLDKHGNDVTTEILKECETKSEIKHWGEHYSTKWDIVKSANWANLTEENGAGGDYGPDAAKVVSRKLKETQNDPIWRATTGKQLVANMLATRADPLWKATVGRQRNIRAGNSISKTRNDPIWKSTIGRQTIVEYKKTIQSEEWIMNNTFTCEYCNKTMTGRGNFNRWHGANCKENIK